MSTWELLHSLVMIKQLAFLGGGSWPLEFIYRQAMKVHQPKLGNVHVHFLAMWGFGIRGKVQVFLFLSSKQRGLQAHKYIHAYYPPCSIIQDRQTMFLKVEQLSFVWVFIYNDSGSKYYYVHLKNTMLTNLKWCKFTGRSSDLWKT